MSKSRSDTGVRIERLRALTVGRGFSSAFLVVLLGVASRDLVDPTGWPLLLTVAVVHLTLQLAVLLVPWRSDDQAFLIGEVALVADVVAIAVVLALTGGVTSPLAVLLVTEVVAVTLLFGRAAGVRASLLATLVAVWVLISGSAPVLALGDAAARIDPALATSLDPALRTAMLLLVLWATALITGWLSDVTARDLRRRSEDLAILRDLTPDLDPRRGPDEVARALAVGLVDRLRHQASAVWLPDLDHLRLAASHGVREHPSIDPAQHHLALDEPLIVRARDTSEVVPIPRDQARPDALAQLFGQRAPLALVTLVADERVVGLIAVQVGQRLGRGPAMRVREVRLLRMLADHAALLIDNARLQAELADLAVTDAVTGLPNHRFLQQRLAEELDRVARRGGHGDQRALSFALFDLDHFKDVNDTFGHPTGDRVLATVATAAARTLRGSDVVCRYGGEEFGIVLVDTDVDAARQACERVRHAIRDLSLTALDGRPIGRVSASFGIATTIGEAVERATIIEQADSALYQAKESGRDRVVHHDEVERSSGIVNAG